MLARPQVKAIGALEMTIFRHKNGLLYTLAQRMGWKRGLEAMPYHHSVEIRRAKIADFVAVAEK